MATSRGAPTILRDPVPDAPDPQALALAALGWVLRDDVRADRLLSLTGLTPDSLRARIGESALLAAVLEHLCAHEPELLASGEGVGVTPDALVAARDVLEAQASAHRADAAHSS